MKQIADAHPDVDGNGGESVVEYVLILGSNRLRARHLRLASRRIAERFEVVACAPARRTRDAGGSRYLNAGMRIRSTLDPGALREALRSVEDEAGRDRAGPVCALDIDAVLRIDAAGQRDALKPDDLERAYVRDLLREVAGL